MDIDVSVRAERPSSDMPRRRHYLGEAAKYEADERARRIEIYRERVRRGADMFGDK